MPDVAFHTGIADTLGYTCRLLRKAHGQGVRVVVTGAAPELSRLDVQLWTFEQEAFIPHARLEAGEQASTALARTPIWLADDAAAAPPGAVLVNLGPAIAVAWVGFERVIEIVSDDPDAVQAGRMRWRAYVAAGVTPTQAVRA